MKRMLINATQEEELRMAMVDGQRLYDLNIEGPASERKKANIYKGKITRIEPSLEAAFVDYGAERHGFLPMKEISPEYFVKGVDGNKKPNIREVLKEGQDIVVQIDKEERGNKGAALTTYVSLAGRFIVLKPNKSRSGGVSRRIVGEDRDLARDALKGIEIPKEMSVILRTAGIGRTSEELAWDIDNLLRVWQAILDHVLQRPAPFLLYREDNAVLRALRDYLTNEIGEILIDDEATFAEAMEFVELVMPHNAKKMKLYQDPVPLFTRFQIESQIESAFAHSVNLPSGGSIVIDHTEALVAIDINSARATKGGDIEATALNTNLEAAEEIARQLRIRDLGGLVVIDFIDMGPQKNQREVENRLRESVRQDRARIQIGKITRFGLLEMSRQRLRPSIGESAYQTCPRCTGFGTIRSNESLALAILRIIGEEARKERTAKVIAQLPVEVATYLLNEKRDWVQSLETSNDTQVILVANSHLETPHYDIRRVRDDQTELPENAGVSYSLAETDTTAEVPASIEERKVAEQAAIAVIKPTTPAPVAAKPKVGFWAWLTGLFAGSADAKPKKKSSSRRSSSRNQSKRGNRQRGRGSNDQNRQGRNQQRKKKPAQKKSSNRKRNRDNNKDEKAAKNTQSSTQSQPEKKKEESRDGKKRPSRNRRSRGGRRRRRSNTDRPNDQVSENKPAGSGNSASDTKSAETQKPGNSRNDTAAAKPAAAADSQNQAPKPAPKPVSETPVTEKPRSNASSSEAAKPADVQASAKPADAPKPRPEKPADNGRDNKPAAGKPAANGGGDKPPSSKPEPASDKKPVNKDTKPEGRLLPWDTPPASKPADSSDQ